MPELKQKVSGCLCSQNGLDAFCTIRSYLAAMRKQSRPLFEALAAHAFTSNELSPCPRTFTKHPSLGNSGLAYQCHRFATDFSEFSRCDLALEGSLANCQSRLLI